MIKILLTGANGQLGRCFQDSVAEYNQLTKTSGEKINLHACDSAVLDISNEAAVEKIVTNFQPNFIVNAAAYTAVDKAESEPELADRVNCLGAKNLASAAQKHNVWLLHVSTDYVFDGKAIEPYKTNSSTNPQSVYGKTKLNGELAIASVCASYMIFRTAWVFSEYGNNFVKTMLRLASQRDEVSVVADQYGCPTYAGDIAKALLQVCMLKELTKSDAGIYHVSGDIPTSWHGFARAIFELGKHRGIVQTVPKLIAIPASAYPTPAKRPEYSILNTSKSAAGISFSSDWLRSLKTVIEKLAKN